MTDWQAVIVDRYDFRLFKPWMWGDGVYGGNSTDVADDVIDWCNHHAGWDGWSENSILDTNKAGIRIMTKHAFYFKDPRVAVLFKLTWG